MTKCGTVCGVGIILQGNCCQLLPGAHRPGEVPGAARGPFGCPGLCHGDRSRGLHGVLLSDPEEPKGGVRHGHPGQPAEIRLTETLERQTEAPKKGEADPGQGEESVQVLVETVLLRGVEQTWDWIRL